MTDLIEYEITGMTAQGEGVARHGGKVLFIPGALVGERVTAEIVSRGARFDRARLSEVLVSSGRQETPCRHDHPVGCGGCSLLHATRAAQAAAKRLMVADALQRLAGQDPATVGPTLSPGPDLGYRNHARFGVDRRGALTFVARGPSGARKPSHATVAIETCAVLDPRLDSLRADLDGRVAGVEAVELRFGARTGEKLVILHGASSVPEAIDPTTLDAALVLVQEKGLVPVRGLPRIHEVVLGHTFRISAASFFQVNTEGAECLAGLVRSHATKHPVRRAIDLYAGVGLFTVTALGEAGAVLGIELDRSASEDYRHNTTGSPNVRLRTEPALEVLRDLHPARDAFDLAVVNPPRAGVGQEVVWEIQRLRIPRLIMVSCEAGSFARDVGALVQAGYALKEAVPVDQFPGTPHVEIVATLDRR